MRIAVIVLLLTACVSTQTAVLNPMVSRAATCPEGVFLYASSAKVPADAEEIAILTSKGSSAFTNTDAMLRSVREQAAKVGATGAFVNLTEASAGAEVLAAATFGATARQGQTIAFYSRQDSARTRTICDSIARSAAQVTARVNAPVTLSTVQVDSLRQLIGWKVLFQNAPADYAPVNAKLSSVRGDALTLDVGGGRQMSVPLSVLDTFTIDKTGRIVTVSLKKTP